MRHRLSHRKGGLVQIERALEHHRQHVGRCLRRHGAGVHHFGQPVTVVVMQLLDAAVQAAKRLAVRGQGERVFGQRAELVHRRQEQLQRVGFRLDVVDAHIGRNAGQHHVAADQQLQLVAIQGDVLGGVAIAADAAPVAPADANSVAVHHPAETGRYLRHHARVIAGAAPDLGQRIRVVQTMRSKEVGRPRAAKAGGAARAVARGVVVGGADPQRRIPALAQPPGQADMVRVHVRHDHPQHRQALQLGGEDVFPLCLGGVHGDAAVDDAPALHDTAVRAGDVVAQQPQVDVVQGKRQRHADPANAGGHFQRAAGFGELVTKGVVEFGF